MYFILLVALAICSKAVHDDVFGRGLVDDSILDLIETRVVDPKQAGKIKGIAKQATGTFESLDINNDGKVDEGELETGKTADSGFKKFVTKRCVNADVTFTDIGCAGQPISEDQFVSFYVRTLFASEKTWSPLPDDWPKGPNCPTGGQKAQEQPGTDPLAGEAVDWKTAKWMEMTGYVHDAYGHWVACGVRGTSVNTKKRSELYAIIGIEALENPKLMVDAIIAGQPYNDQQDFETKLSRMTVGATPGSTLVQMFRAHFADSTLCVGGR